MSSYEYPGDYRPPLIKKPENPEPSEIIGDEPTTSLPGEIIIDVPGLKTRWDFLRAIRRGGFTPKNGNPKDKVDLRPLINNLRDEEKHVGASWSTNKIRILTAHKKEIIAAGTAAGIAVAVAGAIYFLKRSPRQHNEK
ncbi:hypothetical protein HYU95_02060 [Candidatus Daviesbacteria bacterium]|nr:hypothetical protein [Candidatus Daviesbacteria bacterium]